MKVGTRYLTELMTQIPHNKNTSVKKSGENPEDCFEGLSESKAVPVLSLEPGPERDKCFLNIADQEWSNEDPMRQLAALKFVSKVEDAIARNSWYAEKGLQLIESGHLERAFAVMSRMNLVSLGEDSVQESEADSLYHEAMQLEPGKERDQLLEQGATIRWHGADGGGQLSALNMASKISDVSLLNDWYAERALQTWILGDQERARSIAARMNTNSLSSFDNWVREIVSIPTRT